MTLYIICGVPGSGKTTIANKIVEEGLSSDGIEIKAGKVQHVDVDWYLDREDYDGYYRKINESLKSGDDVIITAGSIYKATSNIPAINLLNPDESSWITEKDVAVIFMPCSLETALQRCQKRVDNNGHGVGKKGAVCKEIVKAHFDNAVKFVTGLKEENPEINLYVVKDTKNLKVQKYFDFLHEGELQQDLQAAPTKSKGCTIL